MKIQGKTFIVTGAGGGIGGALVLDILARGGRVAGVDLKEDGMLATKAKAGKNAEMMTLHPLNIADREAVESTVQQIISDRGGVDGIINCAGIVQPFKKINDLDFESIERVMNVNFYGTLNMTKALLPHLLSRPAAHVVNVSSMGGFLPVPGQSVYGASKAAVKLLTEGLYAELLNTSVRVSVVFPGATETNITKNSHVDAPRGAENRAEASKYKMLSPEDAARIILNGVEADKMQIFTGSDSNAMNKLYRLNPKFATKFITKKMQSLLQ